MTFYKLRQLYEHPAVQPRVLSMGRDLPLLYRQIGKSGKWQKAAVERLAADSTAITKQVYLDADPICPVAS